MDADVDHPLRRANYLVRKNEVGHWEQWNPHYAHWQPTLTERFNGLSVTITDYDGTWCEPMAPAAFVRRLSL